jgi:molybdenum cofactor guanylyltransferase
MIISKNHEICGIVLAGGKSSRLGRDKAGVEINGRTLLQRSLFLAGEFCSRTYCVGREVLVQGVTARWMLDEVPGMGPMGGIITALKKLKSPCLVLACDLPHLDRYIIERLIKHRNLSGRDKCMTTFHREGTGYIEALVSIYEPRSLDLLTASMNQGSYQLSRAIPFEHRSHIAYGSNEEKYFFNVNYPRDLDKLVSSG